MAGLLEENCYECTAECQQMPAVFPGVYSSFPNAHEEIIGMEHHLVGEQAGK